MTKKFKSSLLLLFLVQLFFAQESEWHWQNPYPLPFIDKLHKTVDGRTLIQHDNDEIYQINDDDTFTLLEMNLPPLDYKSGFGKFYVLSETHWIVLAPYITFITKDGGQSYQEVTVNKYWQYQFVNFIDENTGIAKRIKGNIKQVVRTDNGGESWEVIYQGVLPREVQMVSSDTLYMLTDINPGTNDVRKIKRSFNGGKEWELMGDCKYCDYIVKVNENLLIKDSYQYYISKDDGSTKEELLLIYDGLNDSYDGRCSVFGNTVIINNGKQIFKSVDSGVTWEKQNTGYPDIIASPGLFINDNTFFCTYLASHIGVLKLDIESMQMKPILGTPINDYGSIQRLESGELALHSYSPNTSQHRIYTSKDDGYTWDLHTLKLPDDEIYARHTSHLMKDASFYLGYEDRLYFFENFKDQSYTWKKDITNITDSNIFILKVFDSNESFMLLNSKLVLSDNNFDSYTNLNFNNSIFWDIKQMTNNSYWLIGKNTSMNQSGLTCVVSQGKVDSCYAYNGLDRTYNLLGDDIIVSSDKKGENFRINTESGMTDFCPELKGQVRGIISKDTMIMQDHALLYLANPNTCEVLEYADLDYSSYLANTVKYIDLKFKLLDNGDIFGYDNDGYMIRKTDNFLDTLLYNSSKEVEYEATTQEYQFIVYPNPTSDWLQVKDMPYGVECRIIDMTGREYMHGKQSLIYTGQYPSGTYIIQFFQDGRWIESQKIVIQ